ncbi:hypothetical protein [Bacillus smithii]|uniref:hypothetical protein n=1 Tax=Bacillus smithii TaxID=1479 RepID=UPI002E1A7933|nr:hypothetical protein [Bacillus smithii]
MFSKNKMVIELDERYFNQELSNAVVQHLISKGNSCEKINHYTIILNNKKYTLTEKTINIGVPLQRVILKETK